MPHPFYALYLEAFAFILGACIGSFLNVCIYRMPRNLSVNNPRRSFCPKCEWQIPWWNNLPLVSWLALRGKCANCHAPIAFRYFGVEFLTGALFFAVWLKCDASDWFIALPYWIFVSLLVVATFIDFEHFIIPDEITWGGAASGIVLSAIFPDLHLSEGATAPLTGAMWGLIGAAAGYLLLRSVVELGKLAFGRRKLKFEKPEALLWIRKGEDADLTVGTDQMLWSEFFQRGNEKLLMDCAWVEIQDERFENVALQWSCDWVNLGARKWELNTTDRVSGEVTEVVIPREAMGLGDVKFMACIGAFLGWKAVLFTVMAASLVGSIVGVTAIAARRRDWSAKIPFGPYLALGALAWLFTGPQLVEWYLGLIARPQD